MPCSSPPHSCTLGQHLLCALLQAYMGGVGGGGYLLPCNGAVDSVGIPADYSKADKEWRNPRRRYLTPGGAHPLGPPPPPPTHTATPHYMYTHFPLPVASLLLPAAMQMDDASVAVAFHCFAV